MILALIFLEIEKNNVCCLTCLVCVDVTEAQRSVVLDGFQERRHIQMEWATAVAAEA